MQGGVAMRRKLLQFQSHLAQHALRAAPKPSPQSHFQLHHSHLLHSPSAAASASQSWSSQLLWSRIAGATAAGVLPRSAAAIAAAARTAASRWLAAARRADSLQLFSLQRRPSSRSGWPSTASAFAQGAPWAQWMKSADGVVLTLIGVNVTVFMLWHLADPGFMTRHFTNSLDNFKSGRLHTLLTSAFSHANAAHLCSNMIGLYFFGNGIASMFGPAFLLKLYGAGALAGSAFFLLEKTFLAPQKSSYVGWDSSRAPRLGASTAVSAIVLLEVFLYPKRLIYIYLFIPIPAAFVGAGFIGMDLLRAKKGEGYVSGSHLVGALVAALVWARIRKGWI